MMQISPDETALSLFKRVQSVSLANEQPFRFCFNNIARELVEIKANESVEILANEIEIAEVV